MKAWSNPQSPTIATQTVLVLSNATSNGGLDCKLDLSLATHGSGGRLTRDCEGGRYVHGAEPKRSTPEAPLVSVVTVVYQGERELEKTIASVLNQSYSNVEYLVIDGGSKDGTLALLEKYSQQIDYWLSEPDRGLYDAMNKGVAHARGAMVGLLNAGDTYEPWFVERLIREGAHVRDIANTVLFCHFKEMLEELDLVQYHRCNLDYQTGMSICHQTMLVGRGVYDDLGLYDTSYKLAADYEFLLRMATGGVRFRMVDDYGVTFMHGGKSSVYMPESHREARRINRAYFGFWSRAHWRHVLRSSRQLLAYHYGKNLLYRVLGKGATDRIRLLKKSCFGRRL